MAKVGVLRDPETKEQYFPITVADAVIGLTPGGGVTVTGTSPIAVSNNVVSIGDAYGDTKNPYGAKSANTFLAGPISGSAAVPSFRTLDITDIQTPLPDLYAIESLTGTSGLLKKTAANTWELDTSTYLTSHQSLSGVAKLADTNTFSGEQNIFSKVHRDSYYASNVCRHFYGGTPSQFIIWSKIKYASGTHMPVVRIYGYAYGLNCPIEVKVGFYIYGGDLGWCGSISQGAWNPTVYLFKYTENNVDYVAIGLDGSCYFCGFQVDVQVGAFGSFNSILVEGWTTSHNGTSNTIPIIPAVGTDKCIQVPKKPIATDISGNASYATTAGSATNASNVPWSGVSSKPTTLSGYGITDAKIASGVITLGSNTITPLTQHQDISGKADKTTTLAGYGITDAKIDAGVITLGSNTITPLTSHQTIYALTLQAAGVNIGSTWNPASAAATLNIPVYSVNSNNLGVAGLVPTATAAQTAGNYYLKADGTWQTVSGGDSGTVTQVTAGSGLNTTSGDTTTDGGNITTTGTLHLTKCNNNTGSFGPNSDASPAAGGTFAVPNITVDKWGRVTAASDKTITLPNSGGGGGSSTKNMAAYDWFGPVTGSFTPVHFLTALMKPILDDSASNDVSIVTSNVRVKDAIIPPGTTSIDGHLPIGALILLYAGYLHTLGYSYGRIVVDIAGFGDYSNYFIGHDDENSWDGTINSETVLQGIHAKVIFFNWNEIDDTTGLPLGPSDYNTTTAGISAGAGGYHFNRYTFTFSSIDAGSDIDTLTDILYAIKNEPNESNVTATTNSDNLIT